MIFNKIDKIYKFKIKRLIRIAHIFVDLKVGLERNSSRSA
jgi:hypothetical protein